MKNKTLFSLLIAIAVIAGGCDFLESINPFSSSDDKTIELYRNRLDSLERAHALEREQLLAREKALMDTVESMRLEAEKAETFKRFHLVAGAFRTPAYARSFHEKVKREGYNSQIIIAPNGFHLVTAGSFDILRNAVNEYHRIRNAGDYEVWLYTHH